MAELLIKITLPSCVRELAAFIDRLEDLKDVLETLDTSTLLDLKDWEMNHRETLDTLSLEMAVDKTRSKFRRCLVHF